MDENNEDGKTSGAERLGVPSKEKVIRLFSSKSFFFVVPKYQRSYVWSDRGKSEQLTQFWDDFMDTEKSKGSLPFLGNLILSRTEKNNTYDVVDGQQRLVTIQILFRAIQSILTDTVGKDQNTYKTNIDSLQQTLVSYDEYGEQESLKLTAGKDINTHFRDLILTGKTVSEPTQRDKHWHIWNANKFFVEKIQSYIEQAKSVNDKVKLLMKLFKKIGEVEFIIIILRDQADAYEVFESFNAKGERLNTGDLFKNLLLSKLEKNEIKAYAQWETIIDNVKTINSFLPQFNIDTYLRYCWSSSYGYINPRALYREIKNKTTNYQGFLDNLEKISNILVQLIDVENLTPRIVSDIFPYSKDPAGRYSNKIVFSLKGLTALKTQQYIVWLICLLNNWKHIENRKHIANSLRAIEGFSVLYFTGGSSSANKIEKIFSALSRELSVSLGVVESKKDEKIRDKDTIILNGFKQYVQSQDLIPNKEEFVASTAKLCLTSRNRSFIWYLLEQIEKNRRGTSEIQLDQIAVTLEHLLPQNPDEKWGLTRNQIKDYVNLLGNLTLLDFEINSRIKNEIPEFKLRQDKTSENKFIDDSELKITQEVVKLWQSNGYSWSEELIRQRQIEIAVEIYDIFSE